MMIYQFNILEVLIMRTIFYFGMSVILPEIQAFIPEINQKRYGDQRLQL